MTPGHPARHLWVDPSFGASGDMLLGGLLGLGAPLAEITVGLSQLGLDGWSVTEERVTRGGISAHRAVVTAAVGHHHRSWSSIDHLIASTELPEAVTAGARRTFRLLGEVEAAQHDVPVDEVHFHEVGAVDAIVDIVGVWLALDSLGFAAVTVGPVGLGHGTVSASHGRLPLPAPATAALLVGAPVRSVDIEFETCTPTGAALLASIGDWGPIPDGTIAGTARGAGGRDPEGHPNVVSMIALDIEGEPGADVGYPAVVLSTNVDDVTPEVLGYTLQQLLDAGADDAWIVPMAMKKNRPAHMINVLTSVADAAHFRTLLSTHTGTLGIRATPTTKYPLPRHSEEVMVRGVPIRMKVGPYSSKPEHDDLVALSQTVDVPIRLLAEEAKAAWAAASARTPLSE